MQGEMHIWRMHFKKSLKKRWKSENCGNLGANDLRRSCLAAKLENQRKEGVKSEFFIFRW